MRKWTDQQKDAIVSLDTDLTVTAGAGSGKTTVLVERLMQILERERLALSRIVAITFTNKAASEMKDRLRQKIDQKLDSGEDPGYWQDVKEALPSVSISTIHSLCARILREHPHLAMVDPLFFVLAEDEASLLLEEAAEESLTALAPQCKGLLRLLKNHGKGRVLSNLFACYEKLRSEGQQFGAVWEKSRDQIRLGLPTLISKAQTAEQLGKELLAFCQAPPTPTSKAELELFAEAWDRLEPIRSCLIQGDLNVELEGIAEFIEAGELVGARGRLAEPVKALRRALSELASDVAEHLSLEPLGDFCLLLERMDQNYSQRKKELGALDFADLELLCHRLLQNKPQLAKAYRQQIKYLLVDEYQDTSRLQEKLLANLHSPGENFLFVVGDPKQSIYRFRGAEVAVFGETVEKIESSGGRKIELLDNFRSTEPLISLYNHLFEKLLEGKMEYQPLKARRKSKIMPELLLAFPEDDEDLEEKRQREAQQICARIQSLVQNVELETEDKNGLRPVTWKDVALLFRSTSNLSIYQQALAEAGVPHYVVGGSGYYAKQEVQDVLNMLRWLNNTHDQVALAGVLRSPFFSLSDATLFWLTRKLAIDQGLFQDPIPDQIQGQQREAVLCARSLLREFLTLRTLPLDQLIERILERTGYNVAIVRDFLGKQKLQNLEKLIQIARRFSKEGLVTPGQFIERIEALLARQIREGEAPVEGEEENTVKLLTIHKSKGLEYPVVVVPDISRSLRFSSGNFFAYHNGELALDSGEIAARPSRYIDFENTEKAAELEESKRVFYVALTRARDHLILSGCAEKPRKGGIEEQNSWLGWLASLWEVKKWEELESLAFKGGQIKLVQALEAEPLSEEEQPPTEGGAKLPLLFQVKGKPLEISPTHPPLTPSSFITYHDCPRRYFYAYRWRVDETKLGILDEGEKGTGIAGWRRGQVLHRACEKLLPDSDPRSSLEEAFSYYQLEAPEQLILDLVPVLERYQQNQLCTDLKEAEGEWQFAVGLGPFVMEGSIDKLLVGKTPLVVDFKSNSVTSQGIAALTSYYALQLEAYAYAVHRRLGAPQVELALHYLMPDETVRWRIHNWQATEQKLLQLAEQMVSQEYEQEFETNTQSCSRCRFAHYHLCPGVLSEQQISDKIKTG